MDKDFLKKAQDSVNKEDQDKCAKEIFDALKPAIPEGCTNYSYRTTFKDGSDYDSEITPYKDKTLMTQDETYRNESEVRRATKCMDKAHDILVNYRKSLKIIPKTIAFRFTIDSSNENGMTYTSSYAYGD